MNKKLFWAALLLPLSIFQIAFADTTYNDFQSVQLTEGLSALIQSEARFDPVLAINPR
jgi:hypothetical protein